MAHIESLYDDWTPVSADELYQALSEIAAITSPQPDSPTGWDWALRQLEVLARQALEHRDVLSPVSAAFSYRQGMIYRQFRLRRYGTDRHADLRTNWLNIIARLALEANQRHPGALARWSRTRLVSTEEAVEMLERMRHIQTDPATTLDPPITIDLPYRIIQPFMLVLQRAVDNRTALGAEEIARAITAVETGETWLIEHIGFYHEEIAAPLLDYLTRLGQEIDGQNSPG
jgi:hypothetical protein